MTIAPKIFDIVCIGAYACKAGKEIAQIERSFAHKICYFNQQKEIFQPSLMCYSSNPFIELKQNIQQKDHLYKNPERQLVKLENGQLIKYKQLIFSDTNQNWKNKDYYPNLCKAISTPFTSVYGDHHCKNIKEMFQRCLGNIKIIIPKQRHFGYENYFMLKLKSDILKHAQKQQIKANFKLQILLEGDSFFPHDPSYDYTMKKLLNEAEIPFYTNCQISNINYNRRFIYVNGSRHSYKALYQYLPFNQPSLLKQANIDALKTNPLTLRHRVYNNINILGNVLPISHSFNAMTFQTQIIAQNVIKALNNEKKVNIYSGDNRIPIWVTSRKMMILYSNYQKNTMLLDEFQSNPIINRTQAFLYKMTGRKEIENFFNGNSKGYSSLFRYSGLKTVSTDKSLVPVLLKKNRLSKEAM